MQGLGQAVDVLAEITGDGPRRRYIKRQTAQARAYSQAVITEGGRIVWLAGQVGAADASGNSLSGDFDGQVREVFARLSQTLEEAGGCLADMVTMTVFITDARHGDRFTELRKEIFGDNFPASALITVAGLARPEMLVEVQGIAVIA
ncbi:MAG TPA: RidA family protein [Stellaceae bacterium]|nr:RidA family protein [Stellaceae bacterium]